MQDHESVLNYWFGPLAEDAALARAREKLWWQKSSAVDSEIKNRFEALVLAADSGKLDAWRDVPEGRLALILLTDQFPRHIYRNTPSAFRFDGQAQHLCLEGLKHAADTKLRPIQRVFFYLPLEHSEELAHQHTCVRLFEALAGEVDEAARPVFSGFVEYALQHRTIIERFGRFPHRNAILGRESTPEELAFLTQPNSSF